MKVIIAGSRSVEDYSVVKKAIEKSGFEISEVVSGTAHGVDKLGEKWAKKNGIKVKRFPANWSDINNPHALIKENKYGKYNALAGFERNEDMAIYSDGLIVIIKGESEDTKNIIEMAEKYQLEIFVEKV